MFIILFYFKTLINKGTNNIPEKYRYDPNSFFLISQETAKSLDTIDENMKNIILPAVACFALFLNVLCVMVFMQPRLKGKFYKYLLFNSLFDATMLAFVAAKPVFQSLLAREPSELFFYVYLCSVSLTCSSLSKLTFTHDRLFKLNGF